MKSSALSDKNIILIFIDGLGIGIDDPEFNPCSASTTGIFNSAELPFSGSRFPLDATLGVAGLPQSGSGQTSIYTGINAAKLIGRHLFGFPNQELRDLLKENSLFVKLTCSGYKCRFINAFRPVFFTTPHLFDGKSMSATTEMNRAAGLAFSSLGDLKKYRALYHDYSNQILINLGFDVPAVPAAKAADILIAESENQHLLLYEYFETDRAGHARDLEQAIRQIHKLEELILNILQKMNQKKTSLIIISDHGNIEDLRTKSHTRNPAYCALWGAIKQNQIPTLTKITDLYHIICSYFDSDQIN